jgi:porphobilinogen synthase
VRYPICRPRRLRRTPNLRRLVRTERLSVDQLVAPLFAREGIDAPIPIGALPGHHQWPIDSIEKAVEPLVQLNIPAVLLFGIPLTKGAHPISLSAISRLRRHFPDLVLIADCCLCATTVDGHCYIKDNDTTLNHLSQQALAYADAGVDIIAPSAMMDGQVGAIRQALDAHQHTDVAIWSYTVKIASAFYGPFREATHCAPHFGDRRSYQIDPANRRDALLEAHQDIQEGADILMVKPGLPYLDLIQQLSNHHPNHPLGAYQVSGEYAMLKAAADRKLLDEPTAVLETLTSLHRAGADLLITYYAADVARWLNERN